MDRSIFHARIAGESKKPGFNLYQFIEAELQKF
jgi:hypothetical protein